MTDAEKIRELRLDRSALIACVNAMLKQHKTGELCFGFCTFAMAEVILERILDGTLSDK